MARFLRLSKTIINVEAIRFIYPGLVKQKEGEPKSGCTVFFVNTAEPYAFYGDDAEKIMAITRELEFKHEVRHGL